MNPDTAALIVRLRQMLIEAADILGRLEARYAAVAAAVPDDQPVMARMIKAGATPLLVHEAFASTLEARGYRIVSKATYRSHDGLLRTLQITKQ